MKTHDALGWLGVTLIGGSLWALHPALTVGFSGIVITSLSVWMARQSNLK